MSRWMGAGALGVTLFLTPACGDRVAGANDAPPAAATAAIGAAKDAAHAASAGAPHGDHSPHHGGTVLMERDLHLSPSRMDGPDPVKLHRQIVQHGHSLQGMPPILVYRGTDGALMITDGVTRAARAAKLCPGQLVPVEVVGNLPRAVGTLPTVQEKLP